MRADLPLCNFKNCKYQFDGNCTDEKRYDECDYTRLYQKYAEQLYSAYSAKHDEHVGTIWHYLSTLKE